MNLEVLMMHKFRLYENIAESVDDVQVQTEYQPNKSVRSSTLHPVKSLLRRPICKESKHNNHQHIDGSITFSPVSFLIG